eukprot:6157766-Pyramimonas_sp.AAC.1
MNVNHSVTRTIRNVPVRLGYEVLEEELRSDPTVLTRSNASPNERDQCILDIPAYKEHPLVVQAERAGKSRPIPIGIYVDGV